MIAEYQRDAETKAPTLDSADWRDAERDAYAGSDEAERFHPPFARALLDHLRTVAIDVLTDEQARVLAECCESPPLRYDRTTVLTLVELLAMRLIDGKTLEATDFGYEVNRCRGSTHHEHVQR